MNYEPTELAASWIISKINAYSGLTARINGAYRNVPLRTAVPYVRLTMVESSEKVGNGAVSVWSEMTWLAVVVGDGLDTSELSITAQMLDLALHHTTGSLFNGRMLLCVRDKPFERNYEDAGAYFAELGRYYIVRIQLTA